MRHFLTAQKKCLRRWGRTCEGDTRALETLDTCVSGLLLETVSGSSRTVCKKVAHARFPIATVANSGGAMPVNQMTNGANELDPDESLIWTP